MKTAFESGWHLSCTQDFVFAYDNFGNRSEIYLNPLGYMVWGDGNFPMWDMPVAVQSLIALWLGKLSPENYPLEII